MISPRPSTRPTAAIPGKKHYCDCSQYCKGRRTEVHRSTYQRHARFRQADLEKQLARYRRDRSSLSLLEEGSTNRASGTQERMGMMEIRQPQVRPQISEYTCLMGFNYSLIMGPTMPVIMMLKD